MENNPSTHVLTSALNRMQLDNDGRMHSAYSVFEIFYRTGKRKTDADMSKYTHVKEGDTKLVKIDAETVQAICNAITIPYSDTIPTMRINTV